MQFYVLVNLKAFLVRAGKVRVELEVFGEPQDFFLASLGGLHIEVFGGFQGGCKSRFLERLNVVYLASLEKMHIKVCFYVIQLDVLFQTC